jgi:hypothetical protein
VHVKIANIQVRVETHGWQKSSAMKRALAENRNSKITNGLLSDCY